VSSALTTSKVAAIYALEDTLKGMPQANLETRHHFAPGVYVRELRIPAGVCLTGAVHKTEHLNICLRGLLKVVSATADDRMVEAGDIFVSPPGTKRTAYVYEDTVWLTVHATDETDVAKLEQMLVHNDRRLLGVVHSDPVMVDRLDYERWESDAGINAEFLNELKQIPVTSSVVEGLEIRESGRHGMGVFATRDLKAGFSAPAVVRGDLYCWSRYCNHSTVPNAVMRDLSPVYTDLVLVRDVGAGEEVTVNYEQVINRRLER